MQYMTATTDILALCAAIDAGDGLALLALADALEEAGDPRATGIRGLADRQPIQACEVWAWYCMETPV